MSQRIDEQMSAFIDGELPAAELDLLVARLDRNPSRRAALARYAMIGECLRTGSGRVEALDISERVRAALGGDAPASAPAAPSLRASAWRGWVPGAVAAAAAVAAVLVGVPFALQGSGPTATETVATAAPSEVPLASVTPGATKRLNPRAAARLTGYLVAHGQYANQLSRNSFDSHLVSARAERASWRLPQDPALAR
jgi:sigma-E factor negative regulatory protein RseA